MKLYATARGDAHTRCAGSTTRPDCANLVNAALGLERCGECRRAQVSTAVDASTGKAER